MPPVPVVAVPGSVLDLRPLRALTDSRQKLFLERYAACGKVMQACEEAEAAYSAVWDWRQHAEFAAAFDTIEASWTARLRDTSLRRALDDSRPATDLYFELKRRDPAYKDNYAVTVNVGVQVTDWQAAISAAVQHRVTHRPPSLPTADAEE